MMPDPGPGQQRPGAVGLVPGLHGRAAHRVGGPPGQRGQGDRHVRRPPGGGAGLGDGAASGFGHDGHGVDRFQLALGRAHGRGGEALGQLDVGETLGHRPGQVPGRHVLAEVDDPVGAAAEQLRVRVHGQCGDWYRVAGGCIDGGCGPGGYELCPGVGRHGGAAGGLFPGGGGMGEEFSEGAVAGDAAGGHDVARQGIRVGKEPGGPRVVHRAVAGHIQQGGRRGPASRGDHQVTLDRAAIR
jgi:hypothetical protein